MLKKQTNAWIQYLNTDDQWLRDMYEHVLLQGKNWVNSSNFAWDYLQPITLFIKEALESMGLDEDDYDKEELYELITSFIEDYYFENDDVYELMPLGDDDLINYVDRYGDNINKILQADEDEEDVEEVDIEDESVGIPIQVEASDNLDQMTQGDIENGIDYDYDWYPDGNRSDSVRRWASVVTNDDGTLTASILHAFLDDIYADLFAKMLEEEYVVVNSTSEWYYDVVDSDSFFKVMTNLMFDMYIRDAYYKVWDTSDPSAWFNVISVGDDSIEDVLDKI